MMIEYFTLASRSATSPERKINKFITKKILFGIEINKSPPISFLSPSSSSSSYLLEFEIIKFVINAHTHSKKFICSY
jgi:hypothetical protein